MGRLDRYLGILSIFPALVLIAQITELKSEDRAVTNKA